MLNRNENLVSGRAESIRSACAGFNQFGAQR